MGLSVGQASQCGMHLKPEKSSVRTAKTPNCGMMKSSPRGDEAFSRGAEVKKQRGSPCKSGGCRVPR